MIHEQMTRFAMGIAITKYMLHVGKESSYSKMNRTTELVVEHSYKVNKTLHTFHENLVTLYLKVCLVGKITHINVCNDLIQYCF